jgi:transposase
VAPSMLTAAYHMLRDGVPYKDLKAGHVDQRNRTKTIHRLVRRLQDMGGALHVTMEPTPA